MLQSYKNFIKIFYQSFYNGFRNIFPTEIPKEWWTTPEDFSRFFEETFSKPFDWGGSGKDYLPYPDPDRQHESEKESEENPSRDADVVPCGAKKANWTRGRTKRVLSEFVKKGSKGKD